MKLHLQDNVISAQDLKAITMEIRGYARWFSQSSIKTRLAGSTAGEPPVLSEAAVALIKDAAEGQPLQQKTFDDLITALGSLENILPRITITLAAVPPGMLKKTLVAWCREHIDPNILVDFRFNATLLGGMVIRYGSHVYDWSFRRQILAARSKFPEVLRRV